MEETLTASQNKPPRSRTAAAQPQAPQPQERLEPVRLLHPHTHQGRSYPAGHTLAVPPAAARWLRSAGVAAPEAPPPTTTTESEKDEAP